jgi:tetratricopeptide (TPR) repeat protein
MTATANPHHGTHGTPASTSSPGMHRAAGRSASTGAAPLKDNYARLLQVILFWAGAVLLPIGLVVIILGWYGGIAVELMALGKYPFSEYYGWVQDKYNVSWQLILNNPEGDWRPKVIPSLLFTQDKNGKAEEAAQLEREPLQIELAQVQRKLADNPDDTRLYLNRADLHERLCNFAQAAQDLKRFLQSDPTDHWHWVRCGALFLYVGDRESYEWCARELVSRFAENPHSYIGERVAKLCLLDPEGPADLALVERLTERAVNDNKHAIYFGWHKASKAWAEYRAGRYDEALAWATRARREHAPLVAACEGTALLITAMSQHRLGQHDAARKALSEAATVLDAPLSKRRTVQLAELIEHILLAEAQKLIGEPSTEAKASGFQNSAD